MSGNYPVCCNCGGEINPRKYDGCEKAYTSEDGLMCRECFVTKEIDYLIHNTDEYARMIGVEVSEVD